MTRYEKAHLESLVAAVDHLSIEFGLSIVVYTVGSLLQRVAECSPEGELRVGHHARALKSISDDLEGLEIVTVRTGEIAKGASLAIATTSSRIGRLEFRSVLCHTRA